MTFELVTYHHSLVEDCAWVTIYVPAQDLEIPRIRVWIDHTGAPMTQFQSRYVLRGGDPDFHPLPEFGSVAAHRAFARAVWGAIVAQYPQSHALEKNRRTPSYIRSNTMSEAIND